MAISDESAGLLFRIKTDNADAVAKLAETKAAIKSLGAKNELASAEAQLKSLLEGGTNQAAAFQAGLKGAASEAANLVGIFTGDRLTGATSQLTSFAGAIGSIPGVAGIAVGAVAAWVTALVGVSDILLKITENTAEFGSKIHDLAEQTGLTTETISSLKVAADESGTSIEIAAKGIQKFTILMGDAAKGSDDAKAKLKALGVTSTDLDTGLAQVVKRIYELKPGIEQNTAAADAFGKRMGAELIPLINQFHGNLPGLIADSAKLGLTWSKDDADAADKFGDQMTTLDKQFQAIKATLGKQLIPVFLDFATNLSNWLSANKAEIKTWAVAVEAAVLTAVHTFKLLAWAIQQVAEAMKVAKGGVGIFSAPPGMEVPTTPTGEPSTTPANNYTDADAQAAQKAEAEKEYKERLASLSSYYAQVVDAARNSYKAQLDLQGEFYKKGEIDEAQYRANIEAITQGFLTKVSAVINQQEQIEQAQAKNDIDRQTAYERRLAARAALEETFNRDRAEAERNITEQHKKASEQEQKDFEAQIAVIKELISAWEDYGKTVQGVLDRVNAQLDKWAKLNQEAADAQKRVIDANRELLDAQAEGQRTQLQQAVDNSYGPAHIKALEALRAFEIAEAQRHYQQIQDDLKAEQDAALESIKGKENEEYQKALIEEEYRKKGLAAAEEYRQKVKALNTTQTSTNPFEALTQHFKDQGGFGGDLGVAAVQAATVAFQQLGQAVGDAVQAFVLYGNAGTSVRKVTAQILAAIAQQSAIQAVYEFAQGLAALALAFFGVPNAGPSATAHFASSAAFALIAGASALAGRAIAGNEFNKQANAATGTGASASGSGQTIDQNPTPFSRNTFYGQDRDQYRSDLVAAVNAHTQTLAVVGQAVNDLHQKITGMPPGTVVARGLEQSPGLALSHATQDASRNGTLGTNFLKAAGVKS